MPGDRWELYMDAAGQNKYKKTYQNNRAQPL